MRLNLLILSMVLFLWNTSCHPNFSILAGSIEGEGCLNRNFEISKLKVESLSPKKKYPIKYEKEETFICSIQYDLNTTQTLFTKQYPNVDDYWVAYDTLDSLYDYSRKPWGSNKLFWFQQQNHIRWIQYPFLKNDLVPTLPIPFEKKRWYKISHLVPAHYGSDVAIFFRMDEKGKVQQFRIIEP